MPMKLFEDLKDIPEKNPKKYINPKKFLKTKQGSNQA